MLLCRCDEGNFALCKVSIIVVLGDKLGQIINDQPCIWRDHKRQMAIEPSYNERVTLLQAMAMTDFSSECLGSGGQKGCLFKMVPEKEKQKFPASGNIEFCL